MKNKPSKALRTKIIIMYLFMTILNITLLTLIISDNQVEIMTENASFKAQNVLISISKKLKEYTTGFSSKKATDEEKLKLLDSFLSPVVPDYLISDENGKIIYKAAGSGIIPDHFVENLRKSISDQEFTGSQYTLTVDKNSDSIQYYYPLNQIGYYNWVLYATYDLKSVRGKYDKLFNTILIMVIAVVLFHLFMAFFSYRQIIAPIFRLREGTQEIAGGNYETRIRLKRNDEIGELADGFNVMAQQISNEVVELKDMVDQVNEYNEVMKFQMNIAQKIQSCIIPKIFPESDMLHISGAYIPLDDLGGDFYDIYKIDDNKLALVIADVSGHGIPAALITMMAKISFSSKTKPNLTSAEIMNLVNRELCGALLETEIDSYLTVFYCIIDLEKMELEYSGAGHNDIFVFTKNRGIITLPSQSPILGKMDFIDFISDTIKLEPGDKLVLYTDGLPEARNEQKEFLSIEKFQDLLLENQDLGAVEMVKNTLSKVYEFLGGTPAADDMTLLIAEVAAPTSIQKTEITYFEKLKQIFEAAREDYRQKRFQASIDKLLSIYQKFNRKDDNFKIAMILGYSYYQLENYAEALDIWEKALELNPSSKEMRRNINFLKNRNDY